jgi:hypothetical protein
MGLINRWDEDERASRVMKMIQEYIGCCGASGNRSVKSRYMSTLDAVELLVIGQ